MNSAIELLPGNRTRDIYGARCLVAQGRANSQAVTQNEVGKIAPSTRRSSAPCSILRPESVEGNQASSGVGLQIVVIGQLKLPAHHERVLSADHGEPRGEV